MAKKDYTEIKTVLHVRRLNNSVNGNPAWMVTFDDLSFARTMSDTSWSYEVTPGSIEGKTLLFTFTPAGRIRWATKVEKAKGLDYNRPIPLWVCENCIQHHANGECGDCHSDEGHDEEPLRLLSPYNRAAGLAQEFHECGKQDDTYFGECDCEHDTFSTMACDGCGSSLHGGRNAMTMWEWKQ